MLGSFTMAAMAAKNAFQRISASAMKSALRKNAPSGTAASGNGAEPPENAQNATVRRTEPTARLVMVVIA